MPSISKQIARKLVFPTMHAMGLERLLSAKSRNKMAILCYHGVSPSSSIEFNGRHITNAIFEAHLRYFKEHFEVLPLSEIFQRHREGFKSDRIAIAITFDDGYLNNYSHAFRLLKQYELPGTFFVSGCCMEENEGFLWPDYMDAIRNFQGAEGIEYDGFHFRRLGSYGFADPDRKQDLYTYVKHLNETDRTTMFSDLNARYDTKAAVEAIPLDFRVLMEAHHAKEMAESPLIEIGSHGHRHYNLAFIPEAEAEHELLRSKQLLEAATGQPVVSIAFPDGNYSTKVKALSRKAGYQHMLAEDYLLDEDWQESDILHRISISGTTNQYSHFVYIHQNLAKRGV